MGIFSSPTMSKVLSEIGGAVIKRAPEILAALGITGFVGACLETGKATKKACDRIEEYKEETGETDISPKQAVEICWDLYIGPVVLVTSATCLVVSGTRIATKRAAGWATAYSLSETAYREYREAVKEQVGPKKEKEIRDEVAEKQIQANPPKDREVYLLSGNEILCFETVSKKYFKSTVNEIEAAKNRINLEAINANTISANDYIEEFGLKPEPELEDIGWSVYSRCDLIDISYGHKLTDDNVPVLVISPSRPPTYDFV